MEKHLDTTIKNNEGELKCQICLENYTTEEIHKPKVFGCGHSICNQCCKKMLSNNQKACPLCKKSDVINNATPDNYALLEQIETMKKDNNLFISLTKHQNEVEEIKKKNLQGIEVVKKLIVDRLDYEENNGYSFTEFCSNSNIDHQSRKVIHYCPVCLKFCCDECSVVHNEENHSVKIIKIKSYSILTKAIEKMNEVISSLANQQDKSILKIKNDMKNDEFNNKAKFIKSSLDKKIELINKIKNEVDKTKVEFEEKINKMILDFSNLKDVIISNLISSYNYNERNEETNSIENTKKSLYSVENKIALLDRLYLREFQQIFEIEINNFYGQKKKIVDLFENCFEKIKEVLMKTKNQLLSFLDSYDLEFSSISEATLLKLESLKQQKLTLLEKIFIEEVMKVMTSLFECLKSESILLTVNKLN